MPLDKTAERRFGEPVGFLRTVRESVAILVKTIPIDVTLSTSGTAEDLLSLESNLPPAYNAITNPSMETVDPPTGWVAVGSTLSRVATGVVTPRTNTYSLQAVCDNVAAGEGAYFEVTGMPTGRYAFSVYVRQVAGGTVRLRATHDDLTTSTDSAAVTLDGTWQRLTVDHLVQGASASYSLRLYVVTPTNQALTLWVEDAQIEPAWAIIESTATGREQSPPGGQPTDFVDPTGDRFSRWLGTADASASVREPTISEIFEIHLEGVNANLYIDYDRTAQNSGGAISHLVRAGDTINGKKVVKNNISFINAVTGQLPRIRGWVLGQ